MKLMKYFTKSPDDLAKLKEQYKLLANTNSNTNSDCNASIQYIQDFFDNCWNDMNNIIDNDELYTTNFCYIINDVNVLSGLKAFTLQDGSELCYGFQKHFGEFVKKVKANDLQCRIIQDDETNKFKVIVDIFDDN